MMDKYSINVRVEMQELGPLPTTPAQPAEPTCGTEGQLAVPLPGPPVPVLLSPAPSSIAPTIADATPADAPSSDTPAKPSLDSLMDEVSAALAALKMVEGATSSPATVMRQATLEEMPAVVRTPRSLPGTGEAAKEVTPASDSKAGGAWLVWGWDSSLRWHTHLWCQSGYWYRLTIVPLTHLPSRASGGDSIGAPEDDPNAEMSAHDVVTEVPKDPCIGIYIYNNLTVYIHMFFQDDCMGIYHETKTPMSWVYIYTCDWSNVYL